MIVLWYLVIFFIGASVGSFLNVLIMRMIEGENFVKGRSHCDHCQTQLSWLEMVPVLSFMWLRGQTRCCQKRLSYQYPIVEALVGVLFVWWILMGALFFRLVAYPLTTMQPIFWLLIALVLTVIFVMDLFYGLIPSPFVWGGVTLTVMYRVILMTAGAYQAVDLLWSVVAALAAASFFWFLRYITKGKGMGEGDVILAVLVGLLLGWPRVVVGVLSSFILGAIISLGLIAMRRKKFGQTVPFGPFMILGLLISLMWGERILTLLF